MHRTRPRARPRRGRRSRWRPHSSAKVAGDRRVSLTAASPLRRGQAKTNSRVEAGLPDADQPADLHSGKATLTNPLPNPMLGAFKDFSGPAGTQQFGHGSSSSVYVLTGTEKTMTGWSKLPGRFSGSGAG